MDKLFKDTGLLIGGPFDGERRYEVVPRDSEILRLTTGEPVPLSEPNRIALSDYKIETYQRMFLYGKDVKYSFWMYYMTNIDNVIARLFAAYRK